MRVEEPEIAAPRVMASVLIIKALAPMAIVPAAPVVNAPAVIVVAPRVLAPPTAPFMVTVPLPAVIVKVRAVLEALLRALSKVTLLSVVTKAVLTAKVTAPPYS